MVMHTDETVFHLHRGGEPASGRDATREAFADVLAQWPDIRFERKRVHIGEGHFVSEYEMSATSDGQVITCDGVDVIAVEGAGWRVRTRTWTGLQFNSNSENQSRRSRPDRHAQAGTEATPSLVRSWRA
jgi:hypothetical protein